jgi:hypothetical protein
VIGSLENAFVNSLDDPTPSLCGIPNSWTPQMERALRPEILALVHRVQPPQAVDAEPIDDPHTACRSRNYAPRVVTTAQPQTPAIAQQQGITGNVFVTVDLRADSSIASTTIFKSPSVVLNPSSLQSAQGSIYQTAISDCRPIAARYSFIVTYDAYPRR